jgi:hypothetical protein
MNFEIHHFGVFWSFDEEIMVPDWGLGTFRSVGGNLKLSPAFHSGREQMRKERLQEGESA